MDLFFNNRDNYEKVRDEIINSWSNCSVCNDKITPREEAEFNGKCEDCIYDSRD